LAELASAWSEGKPISDLDFRTASHIRTHWPAKDPHQITPGEVADLVASWEGQFSPATTHAYAKGLKRFLTFVDERASTRLKKLVPRHFAPQPRKLTCTDDEYNGILQKAPTWLRVFLELCRCLAFRHGEALKLTPRSFNADTGDLHFPRKDGGSSTLPTTPEIAAAIRLCAANPDTPIITALGGPKTQKAIRRQWRTAIEKAGANPNLIIHDLRRTAITRVYNQTHDLRLCQQLAGHRHLGSTLLYLAPNEKEQLAEAVYLATPNATKPNEAGVLPFKRKKEA
jgi:integrase